MRDSSHFSITKRREAASRRDAPQFQQSRPSSTRYNTDEQNSSTAQINSQIAAMKRTSWASSGRRALAKLLLDGGRPVDQLAAALACLANEPKVSCGGLRFPSFAHRSQ